jgi:membrane protein YdbS with pleckstrin-like domain
MTPDWPEAPSERPSEVTDTEIPAPGDDLTADIAPSPPAVFDRQMLSPSIRWVWFVGYLIQSVIVTIVVLQIDIFVLPTRTGLVTAVTLAATLGLSIWRTRSRYENWSWELDATELIIDRGVVFKLTRIVPRVRVQHVDLSSGPVDRFFDLRQVSIYTAGTREADASIPGLTAERAEALRQALIARPRAGQ